MIGNDGGGGEEMVRSSGGRVIRRRGPNEARERDKAKAVLKCGEQTGHLHQLEERIGRLKEDVEWGRSKYYAIQIL